jgi:hypothetical protein
MDIEELCGEKEFIAPFEAAWNERAGIPTPRPSRAQLTGSPRENSDVLP